MPNAFVAIAVAAGDSSNNISPSKKKKKRREKKGKVPIACLDTYIYIFKNNIKKKKKKESLLPLTANTVAANARCRYRC